MEINRHIPRVCCQCPQCWTKHFFLCLDLHCLRSKHYSGVDLSVAFTFRLPHVRPSKISKGCFRVENLLDFSEYRVPSCLQHDIHLRKNDQFVKRALSWSTSKNTKLGSSICPSWNVTLEIRTSRFIIISTKNITQVIRLPVLPIMIAEIVNSHITQPTMVCLR